MAKGKGSKCPHCNNNTWHDSGSYSSCATCGYIGWSWHTQAQAKGKGKGNSCSSCDRQTLHEMFTLPTGQKVRRCATCNFCAIEPASIQVD